MEVRVWQRLHGKEVIPCSIDEMKNWEPTPLGRHHFDDGSWLSTVFLPVQHHGGMNFETMYFGLKNEEEDQWRWRTYDEAVAGHAMILKRKLNSGKRLSAESQASNEFMEELRKL